MSQNLISQFIFNGLFFCFPAFHLQLVQSVTHLEAFSFSLLIFFSAAKLSLKSDECLKEILNTSTCIFWIQSNIELSLLVL